MFLTPDHQKIYEIILDEKECNLALIINETGFTREKVESFIKDLEDFGLVLHSKATSTLYALAPYSSTSHFESEYLRAIARITSENTSNKKVIDSLIQSYEKKSPHIMKDFNIKVLYTKEETRELIFRNGRTAKKSIKFMNISPGFGVDEISVKYPDMYDVIDSGVKMLRIVSDGEFTQEQIDNFYYYFKDIHLRVYSTDMIPFQTNIIDDTHCIVSDLYFPHHGVAFYTDEPYYVQLISNIFDRMTRQAEEIEPSHTRSKYDIVDNKEDKLRYQIFNLLLNEGLSEKEVRSQLSIADRTYRHKMQEYADSVEAKNKAQLFAYAASHRWHLKPKN